MSAVDLILTIRRALAQAATLPPEMGYYVAVTAVNDAQQSLAGGDLANAACETNDYEKLSVKLDQLPTPPDIGALDAVYRAVCLIHKNNTEALTSCTRVLERHVAAVDSSSAAGAIHLARCEEIISLIQTHPAGTRTIATGLSELQARCKAKRPPTSAWCPPDGQVASSVTSNAAAVVTGGAAVGTSPRPKLQPTRTAPPLPNVWAAVGHARTTQTAASPAHGAAVHPPQIPQGGSPSRRRSAPNTAGDRAMRVRSWLKTLRLHKYCSILEQMNYEDMVALTESDLEKLGITAKGARSKMLKSIGGLKIANQQAEQSMAKFNTEVRSGIFSDAFAGLTAMLEPDQAPYLCAPRPEDFDATAEFLETVRLLYTSLILGQSKQKPQQKDVRRFFALLDKALRHEHFPVEDKKTLFNWKQDCQRVLHRGDDKSAGGGGGGHRASPEGAWGGNSRGNRGPAASKQMKHRSAGGAFEAWSSPTRGQRAGSFREQGSNRMSPVSRHRGNSFGSSQENQHSPAAVSVDESPLREAKSEERLMAASAVHSLDAFGFGPVASIWGTSAEHLPTRDSVFAAQSPPGLQGVPPRGLQGGRPPADIRHLWQQMPVGQNPGEGHHQSMPGGPDSAVFVPTADAASFASGAQDGDAAAAAWFDGSRSAAGGNPFVLNSDASSLMNSIVTGATTSPDTKRNTANF
mmetsp:Transcript_31448/g.82483  ORF Transcript_31448/g.82483 Transcript_31448/m.82483 type:complete len:690 (+) Transcript_31448:62-2131(+)|eukprot:CAMPEP_0182916392 /NCGR_PEP_ID=MMETSP0105_2-20130417/914_1 /TAXON_ID=81532 ORGANISM="Acanthoeca-like sp., Strain 10tr" /NCGR_SAMPLE_ID=MMETSP0105_2 /ASSEMBLY_ACC=CAM_ASM_000205 /LENGTH=689 /DNA_ID=CAMNT_0025053341 /DNA_START=45 /DNA_END=2114 /DNA_ORIENTATION=-